MKKIFFILTLALAFSVNVSAQEKRTKVQITSQTEATELSTLLNLDKTQTENFYRLFEMKNETLNQPNISVERVTEMNRIIDLKIRATLTPEQMTALEAKPELYNRLIGKAAK